MPNSPHADIWVMAEIQHDRLTSATLELLGEAVRLGSVNRQNVTAVIWGGGCTRRVADLGRAGADRVLVLEDPRFDVFQDEFQAETLLALIQRHRPEILLFQASAIGRALAPRVAALTGSGLTADCTALAIDPASGALLQTRPAFGGSLMATIRSQGPYPQMATVRPGVMKKLERPRSEPPLVITEIPPAHRWSAVKSLIAAWQPHGDGHSFENVTIVVAGGRGLSQNGFALLHEFAALTGAAVGASRAAVDANRIGYPHQVGQTGRTVQPDLYLAFGISGQIQHLMGMQTAQTIVAVNSDPNAPLMHLADLAIAGDAEEILSGLVRELRQVKP